MEILELQQTNYDCGPSALHGALKLYGRNVDHRKLSRWAGTTQSKGTPAAGLKRALEKAKVPYAEYQSTSRNGSWSWARRQQLPAVLSFDNDNHWVLLVAGLGKRVLIFDPEKGLRIYAKGDFLARWTTKTGRVYALRLVR